MRLFWICLLLVLPVGCSTGPVKAPVGTRSTQPQVKQVPARETVTTRKLPTTRKPPTRTNADTYFVQRGDTLYSIAWQHGLNTRQLAGMNAIRAPYTIYTGQRLRVKPGGKPSVAAASSPNPPSRAATRPVAQAVSTPKPVTASTPAPPGAVSQWVWPAKGPLLRGYHPDSSGKKGIDIGGTTGQPVIAAADGKVVYSGSGLVGYGRLIIVKHNESLLSAYGHNSELLATEGDWVKAGRVIAKMGSSGTDRTLLYFEIRKEGKPVNPLRYLPKR